ncbi:MAG: hypothetical protein IPM82_12540 [Saprospiraceae bacterium]|nr:hypothetical protein [Saprospiraceae bacterium]
MPSKGSFNKIVSSGDRLYCIYTSNLELPGGKQGLKAYFVEVDFGKGTVRTACITDHIKDLGRLDGTPQRLIVEEDFAYLSITRQDNVAPENRSMPFLKEFLRIDLPTMQVHRLLEERSKMADEIFPSNGKYLTKHHRMKDYKTVEAVVYYLREI